jgi:hypothetical protein
MNTRWCRLCDGLRDSFTAPSRVWWLSLLLFLLHFGLPTMLFRLHP